MTTHKNTTETASSRGGYSYMELLSEWELVDNDDSWKKDAACKDMDSYMFFPEQGANHHFKKAKKVCARCPVYKQCMNFAIVNNIPYGVWGGLTPKERERSTAELVASLEGVK